MLEEKGGPLNGHFHRSCHFLASVPDPSSHSTLLLEGENFFNKSGDEKIGLG